MPGLNYYIKRLKKIRPRVKYVGYKFEERKANIVLRRGPWLPFRKFINNSRFNSNLLNLFFILWKTGQNKRLNIYTEFNFNSTFNKNYFYLLIWKLIDIRLYFTWKKIRFFPFISITWTFFLFVETYKVMGNFFYVKSKFLKLSRKQVLYYSEFQLSIPFFSFLYFDLYMEYFRFFKYNEYIKRLSNSHFSPKLKNCFRRLCHFSGWPLWKSYRQNIYMDDEDGDGSYIGACRIYANNYKTCQFKNNSKILLFLLNLKKNFWIKWPFLISEKLQRVCFHLYYNFFALTFMLFIYRCFYMFKRYFFRYKKFKQRSVKFLFRSLKVYRFNYTKWINLYYLRTIITNKPVFKINYYFLVSFFNYKMIHVVNLMLVDFWRGTRLMRKLVPQFTRDALIPITDFLGRIGEIYIDLYYFDLSCIYEYYNSPDEFLYWLSLFKYNLDSILWEIYSSLNIPLNLQLKLNSIDNLIGVNRIIFFKVINKDLMLIPKIRRHNRKFIFIQQLMLPLFGSQILFTQSLDMIMNNYHYYLAQYFYSRYFYVLLRWYTKLTTYFQFYFKFYSESASRECDWI